MAITTGRPVSMIATSDGVVLDPQDGTPGVVVRDGRRPVGLPGRLERAAALLPGPSGHLWVLRRVGRAPSFTSATLVDERGHRDGPHLYTSGRYGPDGSGGLLVWNGAGVWQRYPPPARRLTTGRVTAVGLHHLQVLECDAGRGCREFLVDRRHDRRTALPGHDPSYGEGVLSPRGTRLAGSRGYGAREPGTTVVRVADGTVLHVFPGPPGLSTGPLGSLVWLSERWLAALHGGRLTFYDSRHDHTIDFPVGHLRQLAWRPAPDAPGTPAARPVTSSR
ncbi:hypothetical protein [Friedmanniella luteola]|uniref:hypothetical protein n=1 Tax=Friedmanniella luteola TaxID=546871 RepID=UPI0012FE719D|nr:hypothetical protein [Friedmanniella luteola]